MSEQPYFQCPRCNKFVVNTDQAIAEHYSTKEHDKGLYTQPQPQAPPQQFYPQNTQAQPPMPQNAYPHASMPNQSWPYGNAPRKPPTRYLRWTDQIKGMWEYYRLGMIYYTILVMLATIALLTRL